MPDERRFIEMDDGVRIAVTLHTPETAPPWPVVFEARPYRKDDLSDATVIYRRLCDEGNLAVCRADVRGTGSSEGNAVDEYTERELRDHVATIAWLAAQDWSNGSVGMYGTSYSGFNSLQVAALRPPALKAIIPIYATDRRYTDDVHYGGGARRGIDFLDYPAYMVALIALPPVPSVYGDGWREEWHRRIEANDPWELGWLEHQNEDDYWRHGSVFFDYGAIEAATLVIAGHADGYRNMAFRAFEKLQAPKKILFGPWSHMSPRLSMPGPRIDHVPVMIDWWQRWLGRDGSIDVEPPISIFVRRWTDPEPDVDTYAGEWRAEPTWPPARLTEDHRRLSSAAASVGTAARETAMDPGTKDVLDIRGDVGVTASIWCAATLPFGLPWDQRPDEAFSLVYDWPVREETEIMGRPRVELSVASSVSVAFVSAKLCDVSPDGRSAMVTRGILNLTHRDSDEHPEPAIPGAHVTATVELDATAYVFEPGHTIRLDLAGSDFPSSWPPPFAGTIEIDRAVSTLVLPVLDGPPVLEPPTFAPGEPQPSVPEQVTWRIHEDVLARERSVSIDHGGVRGRNGLAEGSDHYWGEITAGSHEPGNSRASAGASLVLSWDEASVRTESRATLRSDPERWLLAIELEVYDGDERIAERRWERTTARDLQ
ncbi:MAG: CocE/NonD family hydrolase [Actinobacteria bacterium]|nr:CocE/NonD family hydrolase [Actinomycetota bacterium]